MASKGCARTQALCFPCNPKSEWEQPRWPTTNCHMIYWGFKELRNPWDTPLKGVYTAKQDSAWISAGTFAGGTGRSGTVLALQKRNRSRCPMPWCWSAAKILTYKVNSGGFLSQMCFIFPVTCGRVIWGTLSLCAGFIWLNHGFSQQGLGTDFKFSPPYVSLIPHLLLCHLNMQHQGKKHSNVRHSSMCFMSSHAPKGMVSSCTASGQGRMNKLWTSNHACLKQKELRTP